METRTDGLPGRIRIEDRGDHPGLVEIEDEQTRLIPDRKGNKLIFGLRNILVNPRVALLFLAPGTGETLRVHGSAELMADSRLLARKLGGGAELEGSIDQMIEDDYRNNL